MRHDDQARNPGDVTGPDNSDQFDKINQHLRDLQQRVVLLARSADKPVLRLFESTFEELGATLEELRVAQEELSVQTDALEEAFLRTEVERQRYRDLFDNAPDALLVTDGLGVIQEANRAAEGLLELAYRFLRGKPLSNFIPPEDRSAFRQMLLDLRQNPGRDEQEVRIKPRRGPSLVVGVSVAAAPDPSGRPVSLRWVIRDISRRRIAEAERYRLVVESVHDYAVFTLDGEGLVTSWNLGAERLLGFHADEIIGQPGAIIFTPEDRAAGVPEQEMRTAALEGRAEDERWHLKKDGTRFWGSGVMTALLDGSGGVTACAKVMRDMTARHQEKGQLLAELERGRHTAEVLQRAVLQPVRADAIPGLEIAALYEAAQRESGLGGDFYDVFPVGVDRVALVVGDVTGHGLEAARRTAEAKFAARALLHEYPDPAQAVAALNNYLCAMPLAGGPEGEVFVALAVAVVDRDGEATIVAAGCEPPLVLRADGTPFAVEGNNTALGVLPGAPYSASRVHLSPEDRLLLVTDGITEARNTAREFLDYGGLIALAQASRTEQIEAMGQAILDGAQSFAGGRLPDDACLLLVRRLPDSAVGDQSLRGEAR